MAKKANNPNHMANLKNIKPGETRNPNGRPRKLVNVIKSVPKDMQEKVYGVLAYALTLPSIKEAKKYIEKEAEELGQYGFILQIAIKQLTSESWGWGALMDILDRLYGKPKMSADISASGEGVTIVVKSEEEKNKLDNLGGLGI